MKKFSVERVNPLSPMRIVIYGVEGVGKTTLGAMADRPVFITPEGGANRVKDRSGNSVQEIKGVESFTDLCGAVDYLLESSHSFKTLVLDSADWTEKLAHAQIIGQGGKDIIRANGGYGAGYSESENLHRKLIRDHLDPLRTRKGMHVIVTGHAEVKPVKDPEMIHDYDSYRLKCHEKVSSLWREWSDALLFARYFTATKEVEGSERARALGDGRRVVYASSRPAFQAKNRYGLPDESEFTLDYWNLIESLWKSGADTPSEDRIEQVMAEIEERINRFRPDDPTRDTVIEFVRAAGNDITKLISARRRLRQVQGDAA